MKRLYGTLRPMAVNLSTSAFVASASSPRWLMKLPHGSATDEIDRRIATLNACLHRGTSINPVEIARTLEWLLMQPEIVNQADLALRLGKTETWMSRVLRILDLPADLQQRVAVPQVSISIGALAQIAQLQDRRWQDELIDALLAGKSESFVSRRIAQMKGKAPSSRFKADYRARHQSVVTIRSRFKRLTPAQEREVLLDALAQLDQRNTLDETRGLT